MNNILVSNMSCFRFLPVLLLLILIGVTQILAFDCWIILEDNEVEFLDWNNLQHCLAEVSGESLTKNMLENIWCLVKRAFGGIEHVPPEVYAKLGFALTVIPLDELRNISMNRVEVVEAFGAVSTSNEQTGFNTEYLQVIAQKVRYEWLGKNPLTYSQYDLISMGEILCHLNVSDIEQVHADALKDAAEWIGNIEECPDEALQALAKVAKYDNGFGPPQNWSKSEINIMGYILKGLSESDLALIDKDKLLLNRYYNNKNKQKSEIKDNNIQQNETHTL